MIYLAFSHVKSLAQPLLSQRWLNRLIDDPQFPQKPRISCRVCCKEMTPGFSRSTVPIWSSNCEPSGAQSTKVPRKSIWSRSRAYLLSQSLGPSRAPRTSCISPRKIWVVLFVWSSGLLCPKRLRDPSQIGSPPKDEKPRIDRLRYSASASWGLSAASRLITTPVLNVTRGGSERIETGFAVLIGTSRSATQTWQRTRISGCRGESECQGNNHAEPMRTGFALMSPI